MSEPDGGTPLLDEPQLTYLASVSVDLGEVLDLGQTSTGRRRTIPITGGTVSGPHLNGTVLPIGADWQILLDDGTAIINARYLLDLVASTGEKHRVAVTTTGVRTGDPEILELLARGEHVDPSKYYFRFSATASTSSADYRWLTTSLLVATAARTVDQVRYDLYRLT